MAGAVVNECSYCGRTSQEAIACDLEAFLDAFAGGIGVDWEDALEFMPRDGGDWALPDAHRDIWDLLDEFDIDMHPDLREDVIQAFEDVSYAPRYFFDYAPEEVLRYGWEQFVEQVLHRTRFFFLDPRAAPDDGDDFGRLIPVARMMGALGQIIHDRDLVRVLQPGTLLYRGRLHEPVLQLAHAHSLGTAPLEHAKTSSRMSPAGIPMFYGAFDLQTAVEESIAAGRRPDQGLTVGVFEVGQNFHVADLVEPPIPPSVFDAERRDQIPALRFLNRFVRDLSQPIDRDDREHLEYVPTQIVTEYLRHIYPPEFNEAVRGISYRSAVREEGASIVLFVENHDCIDGRAAERIGVLGLVDVVQAAG
jgi:HEPN/RES N-terminal domain 1/RES domain